MHAKVNVDIMHQNTPYRRTCLAEPWRSHIRRRIVLYWMTVFCLSMLNTIVMVQAAPTENGNATNTSDDRLAALTVSSSNNKDKDNDLVLETARAAIIPQSIVSAIVSLIDGFVLGFFPRLGRLKRTLAGLSIGAIIGRI
jgi:hypothetical protein